MASTVHCGCVVSLDTCRKCERAGVRAGEPCPACKAWAPPWCSARVPLGTRCNLHRAIGERDPRAPRDDATQHAFDVFEADRSRPREVVAEDAARLALSMARASGDADLMLKAAKLLADMTSAPTSDETTMITIRRRELPPGRMPPEAPSE